MWVSGEWFAQAIERGGAGIPRARLRTVFFDRRCRSASTTAGVSCPVADRGRYLMDYEAMSVGNTPEEDAAGGLLPQTVAGLIEKLVARGGEQGYVTYDELSATLPLDQLSSEEIEGTLTMLSELGITVTESEESEDPVAPEGEPAKADGSLDHDDTGRTDDPVRMYLREMRSIHRLSREGEVAIAKRIEAGRE